MCGSIVNALDIVSGSGSHERLELQVVNGAHGVSTKKHGHKGRESYDKSEDYQEGPNYNGMNPEYVIKGPFMRYSAANNYDYSPIEKY